MRKFLTFLFVLSLSVSSLLAQDKLSILLVHEDNGTTTTTEAMREAITAAGYLYTDYNVLTSGTPNNAFLENYELVIWNTGKNYTEFNFWDKSDVDDIKAYADMLSYLDNGGILWTSGLNTLSAGSAAAPQTFVAGDFIYDYLGVESYAAQASLAEMLVNADNGICTVDNVTWKWASIGFVDHAAPTSTATSVYTAADGNSVMVYNEKVDAKILSDFIRWDAFDSANPARDNIMTEILDYFNQFANTTKIAVTSFSIVAPTTTVSPYGTLQLSTADVLPEEADNKSVSWAIVSGETSGSINDNGLFTPTDVNGTVVVSATTNDGSAITHEITITVEDKLSILFIHDSDRYPSRADILKSAIINAGYNYAVFDAVAENNTPSIELLSAHELVIWYAGDDQTTHFWNGDDTDNAALKTYLDNGGMLWLQSKNFLNERYAVDAVFQAGDFVFDYLGISKYAIRTPGTNDIAVGVPQFDLVVNDLGITVDPLSWVWDTQWSTDAFEIAATAKGIYLTGPSTHTHAGYYTSVCNEAVDGFKALTTATATGKLTSVSMTNQFVLETLDYFNQFANTDKTPVTEITVSAIDNPIVLGLEETLQFSAIVLPAEASNKTVSWSISEGASASIDQNGLLTSTVTPETVTITATANDGSGISDSYEIEIKSLIPDKLSILLIQDNSSDDGTRIEAIKTAITTAGHEYTIFDAVANAQAPSAEFLAAYELVIWYTGNDEDGTYLWNGTDTDNEALKTYLDNGGMLWLQGLTFLYDRYDLAPKDFVAGDFAYDYLGVQKFAVSSNIDEGYTGGVSQLDMVADNGIVTINSLNWLEDKQEMYVAGCELLAGTQDVYQMGPVDYSLAGNSTAFYNEVTNGFKALTFTFDPSQLKTNLNLLYQEVLDHFNTFANTEKIHVYEVAVTTQSGAVSITEENGTLQMVASVLPESATNATVTWSLDEGSVPATITAEGLLISSGTLEGNGPVYVTATSNDKPEFSATMEISIIGQAMEGFTVLLVNDNRNSNAEANERYLNIDKALTESGYVHIVYNTEVAGSAPNADYMSHFDMVFWYTGNDYKKLYLWDVDYTTSSFVEETGLDIDNKNQVKVNPAIIDYIDNGGIFFQTGLEIMRAIYGRPDLNTGAGFTVDFATGDFVYDYLGISQYIRSDGKYDDETIGGVSHVEITNDNIVTSTSLLGFKFSTAYYVAAYALAGNATALYKFPSSEHIWSELPTIVMNNPATGGTVITNGFELALLGNNDGNVNQEAVNTVTKEFIDYFASQTNSIKGIERNAMKFAMYPNPTSTELNINFELETFSHTDIMVMDNTGRRVLHATMNAMPGANSQKLDVSNLSSGVYFISVRTNNSISSSKFIVE